MVSFITAAKNTCFVHWSFSVGVGTLLLILFKSEISLMPLKAVPFLPNAVASLNCFKNFQLCGITINWVFPSYPVSVPEAITWEIQITKLHKWGQRVEYLICGRESSTLGSSCFMDCNSEAELYTHWHFFHGCKPVGFSEHKIGRPGPEMSF